MNLSLLAILAVAVLAVAGIAVVLVAARSGRRRLQEELGAARADLDGLRARVDAMSHRDERDEPEEFVITSLEPAPSAVTTHLPGAEAEQPTRLPTGEFVTVALSETVVRLVSLGYGVRRALKPENRNRIRFEMRREVKRARRQRRRDVKEARRHLRDGRRTDLAEDAA